MGMAPSDLFITEELLSRVQKPADYLQEKLALQDLATRMVEQPEEVLPRFVDLAIEMTGGVSGGLSLFEENPNPGVFRWQYLRGTLQRFDGATTLRHFSPCGITLDRNAPVLTLHPERVYTWLSDADIALPEVLLVPLYLGSKEPLGTLWIVSDQEGHFDSGHARVMTELAGFVGIALRMLKTEKRLREALDEQEILTREMSHRVQNLFAVTDGMIRLSARSTITSGELAEVLSGRLHALSNAHALVRNSFALDGSGPHVSDLHGLIKAVVAPHEGTDDNDAPRFTISGPELRCGDHATNGVALVIHELATNAVKYGALGTETGHVSVRWTIKDDDVYIQWAESGGPQIIGPPTTQGFGSVLMQSTIVRQFRGALEYDWQADGLSVEITLPMGSLVT
jgi:two-component sensor histidine kinase